MKLFISKSLLFLFSVVCLFYAKPVYLLIGAKYKETVAGRDIYVSIKKSKEKTKHRKLLIGDSVGNQLFPNTDEHDSFNSLACNQAVGMVGHYLLLKNYLDAGNEIDEVCLLYTPFSFLNNLDQIFTYHYYLKPFFTKEYKPFFTETVVKQVKKIPYWYLCREPYVLTSNWAPMFKRKDSTGMTFLSPISIEYLQKIKDLSVEHHFKVVILPPPTNIKRKVDVEKLDVKEAALSGFDEEFVRYFKNINYLPSSYFSDGIHLRKPKQYSGLVLKEWMNK